MAKYEYESIPASERARIFRDRLRGVESNIAVYEAALAVRDGGAEERLNAAVAQAEGLKKLIADAEKTAESEQVDPANPLP